MLHIIYTKHIIHVTYIYNNNNNNQELHLSRLIELDSTITAPSGQNGNYRNH